MAVLDWFLYPFRRRPRRPLATRRPDRNAMGQSDATPLGMEATDMALVNRVNQRNDALERASANYARGGRHVFGRPSTHVEAMPEDETYAARFARVFQKKG